MFPMDSLGDDLGGLDVERMSFVQLRQTRRDSDFLAEMISGVRKLGEPVWVKPIPTRSLVKEKGVWEKRVNEVRTSFGAHLRRVFWMADLCDSCDTGSSPSRIKCRRSVVSYCRF